MNRRRVNRTRQKQINILHTTTRKRHSQQLVSRYVGWGSLILLMTVVVGVALRVGLGALLNYALYDNPHYVLQKIDIEPEGHFNTHSIRQAAGLETGQNLWTLDLPQIAKDLEKLPCVSSARFSPGWSRVMPGSSSALVRPMTSGSASACSSSRGLSTTQSRSR